METRTVSYATSINAYPDIRQVLDRALESQKGIRLVFKDHKEAMTFKGRCHTFRFKDRAANSKTYHEGHPMHNSSVYAVLMLKSPSPTTVEIIKLDAATYDMEDLE